MLALLRRCEFRKIKSTRPPTYNLQSIRWWNIIEMRMIYDEDRQRNPTWKGITAIESSPVFPCPINSYSTELSSCLPLCLTPEPYFQTIGLNKKMKTTLKNYTSKKEKKKDHLRAKAWTKEANNEEEATEDNKSRKIKLRFGSVPVPVSSAFGFSFRSIIIKNERGWHFWKAKNYVVAGNRAGVIYLWNWEKK